MISLPNEDLKTLYGWLDCNICQLASDSGRKISVTLSETTNTRYFRTPFGRFRVSDHTKKGNSLDICGEYSRLATYLLDSATISENQYEWLENTINSLKSRSIELSSLCLEHTNDENMVLSFISSPEGHAFSRKNGLLTHKNTFKTGMSAYFLLVMKWHFPKARGTWLETFYETHLSGKPANRIKK